MAMKTNAIVPSRQKVRKLVLVQLSHALAQLRWRTQPEPQTWPCDQDSNDSRVVFNPHSPDEA
jgi:hypothetical protein